MTIVERADLACREGSKDAVYHIQIVQREGGYTVDYQNGRRGSTLTSLTKTKAPVTLDAAQKIFNRVVREKTTAAPPYRPIAGSTSTQAMTQISAEMAERATGLAPQLLNLIQESDLPFYIQSSKHVAQQKFNGERRFARSTEDGSKVIGANRKGLEVPLEPDLAMSTAGTVCTLDGEIIGTHLYAFDLLDLDGKDLRHLPYEQRKAQLDAIASRFGDHITVVKDAVTPAEKRELLARVKKLGQEGLVFKELDAAYEAGRPSSGGPQVKFKFKEDSTVVVINSKADRRSVNIGVYRPEDMAAGLIPVGAVTIPPNAEIPADNTLIDVQYLYAYPDGSLFQPVFLKPRTDLEMSDASLHRLKFFVEHAEVLIESWDLGEQAEHQTEQQSERQRA